MDAIRALWDAAETGNLGAIRRVLDGGADPNALVPAQTPGGEEYESTALVVAAGQGQLEAAALLLDRGASPSKADSKGFTPLMAAVGIGHAAVLGLLVERGADLIATTLGWTAFHYACCRNHPGCVEALVRADCDTATKTNDGRTGKDLAEEKGHTAVLERLRDLVAERLGETAGTGGTANLLVPFSPY